MTLQERFGQIDIYVFDQILRGNISVGMRILDAGCGAGRNLVYLLRAGAEIFGVDQSFAAVERVKAMARELAPALPPSNFQVAALDQLPYPDEFAEAVICNSVLHFARNEEHFLSMLRELWRVLAPGGLLFCRLGSRIGMSFPLIRPGIYRTGDGSEWYLVDEGTLLALTDKLGAALVDPLKTTVVQNHRCMTTWVLRKERSSSARTALP